VFARLLQNSPIWAKAFAASVVLFVCLGALGATAYLTLDRSARGLTTLRDTNLPRQNAVAELTHDVIATHVKLFRHVTWGSNSVNSALLLGLSNEIRADLAALKSRVGSLVSQPNLALRERQNWIALQIKWEKYDRAARDTLDVAATDAPMATMMLGGTDDDFQQLADELHNLSASVTQRTRSVTGTLADEAESRKKMIAVGGLAGGLISILVTLLVAGSIVRPIRSVTQAMSQISRGNTDLDLDRGDRRDEIGQMINAVVSYRDRLQQQKDELHTQNMRFDTALNNMSQGLAMFDAQQRLVVCNDEYIAIYAWAEGFLQPGMTLREILQDRVRSGLMSNDSLDGIRETAAAGTGDGKKGAFDCQLNDGRCIAVVARPMLDGGTVTTHEDVTERRRAETQIAYMAHHDALTGLANRILLRERIQAALSACPDRQLAVFCLDLDRFKAVNDTLGHPVGDAVLRMAANRVNACIREMDTVARLGGDEFAIVAALAPLDAGALAVRIVEEISRPYDLDGHRIEIGISIGIALAPGDGNDPDELLKNADLALYRAKAQGRNTHRFFEPDQDLRLTERYKLEQDLRRAIGAREFEVHYQPICSIETGRKISVEALVRWRHPVHGLILPDRFIPLAEETGLIHALGDLVLRQACADAVNWPSYAKVAVNLSPLQFQTPDLAGHVAAILADSGLPAHRLELEITETVLLRRSNDDLRTLQELSALGISIALDDFGTGYSSLSYLRLFRFDRIKIDRSFVSEMAQLQASAAIVCAVANLGRSLDIITVAEGVETEEQLALLRAAGCTQAQGYLLGRPIPAADLVFDVEMDATHPLGGISGRTISANAGSASQAAVWADSAG
jgi:diguanylate cyclase (GGDEF)-like protein